MPIMKIGRGRTDKAAVLAGGWCSCSCGAWSPTYFGVELPVMIAVLLLILVLAG